MGRKPQPQWLKNPAGNAGGCSSSPHPGGLPIAQMIAGQRPSESGSLRIIKSASLIQNIDKTGEYEPRAALQA